MNDVRKGQIAALYLRSHLNKVDFKAGDAKSRLAVDKIFRLTGESNIGFNLVTIRMASDSLLLGNAILCRFALVWFMKVYAVAHDTKWGFSNNELRKLGNTAQGLKITFEEAKEFVREALVALAIERYQ